MYNRGNWSLEDANHEWHNCEDEVTSIRTAFVAHKGYDISSLTRASITVASRVQATVHQMEHITSWRLMSISKPDDLTDILSIGLVFGKDT